MSAETEKLKRAPEMDQAVKNMFAQPPVAVKRITAKKPAEKMDG